MPYQLVIKSYKHDDYAHVVAVRETEGELVRVEDGANINLDHANYYTMIEEVTDEDD
jgi:hypothetical protein